MYGYVYNIYVCMCLGLASIDSLTHILMQMTHLTPKNCVNLRWGVCLGIWPVSRFKGAGGRRSRSRRRAGDRVSTTQHLHTRNLRNHFHCIPLGAFVRHSARSVFLIGQATTATPTQAKGTHTHTHTHTQRGPAV